MRVTIIADDKVVAVDELAFSNLVFEIDPQIHSVQWDSVAGWVEYKTDAEGKKPANQTITDFSPYQSAVDAWDVARQSYVPPSNEPEVPPTPQELCKYTAQGLLYDTDWSVLPDVNDSAKTPYLVNGQAFVDYRSALRELVVNPVENPAYPIKPIPVWMN